MLLAALGGSFGLLKPKPSPGPKVWLKAQFVSMFVKMTELRAVLEAVMNRH